MGCNCGGNKKKPKEQVQEILLAKLPGKQIKMIKEKENVYKWRPASRVTLNKN